MTNGSSKQKDPVCGMTVDPANTAFKAHYHNKQYCFCSKKCMDAFNKDPEKHAKE
jgi:Cu+-exporting ATPase